MSVAGALWFAVRDELLTRRPAARKRPRVPAPASPRGSISLLDGLDERRLFSWFHLNRPCLRFVVDLIQTRWGRDASALAPPSEARILAALAFFAHGSVPADLAARVGLDPAGALEAAGVLARFLSELRADFITFPSGSSDRLGTARAFKSLSGIPHVVGVLGFMHVPVTPPAGLELRYRNSLGFHSVVAQMVSDVDGNLLSLERCCPGGTSEYHIWTNSHICNEFLMCLHGQMWVLGSRSLHSCAHVLTQTQGTSAARERFNAAHTHLLRGAGQLISSVKSRFQCLRHTHTHAHTLLSVSCTVTACCVLHNISKKFSVPLPRDYRAEPEHPEAEPDLAHTDQSRDEMIESCFNRSEDGV